MTIDRETVIRLAREADAFADDYDYFLGKEAGWDEVRDQRFAALVLEHGRKPLTAEQVKAVVGEAGYTESMLYAQADFINGIRYSEAAHGITNKESSDAE